MEGRAIGVVVVAALLVGVLGLWAALRWNGEQVVDAAADLTPEPRGGQLTQSGPATTADPAAPAAPAAPAQDTTTTTVAVPDCVIGDNEATGDPAADWATIVVDANLGLPADFQPPDLVDAAAAGFDTGDEIRQIIVEDLDALRRAAEQNGTPVGLVSAYRSYAYQQGLYDRAVEREGEEEAQRGTARPGHSEHQLGTVVDLLEAGSQNLSPSFAETPTGRWLAEHAHEYGFVLSYPDLPTTRTCYEFEPWHFRYVGRDLAATIRESGLAPREYFLSRTPVTTATTAP
ncbi:MAG TPA: M15 family metallopeptidase [Acidimicrobiales bacterium]